MTAPEGSLPVPLLAAVALVSPDGGVGDIDVDVAAADEVPDDPFAPTGIGAADCPRELKAGAPAGEGGGAGDAPPLAPATAPSPAPTNEAAAMPATVVAVVVIALTRVIIVLPTSPRTIRLAMKGISTIENEKILAVSARRIIWLEPTKLFRTPLAFSTESMLDRFTADIRT